METRFKYGYLLKKTRLKYDFILKDFNYTNIFKFGF